MSSRKRNRTARPFLCESLEIRRLLSTITWVNRGVTTGSNNDRFNDVFGSMASQARAVIDADIAYWQRVITNFNYSNGTDTYDLTVTMNSTSLGSGNGFVGANTSTTSTIGGKPSAGTIALGWRTQAASGDSDAGWYLDPTPMDNSEFEGTIQNAFTESPTSSLSGGGFDMLAGVMHEMGHAMGLYSGTQTKAIATDTGVVDTLDTPASSPPSDYWAINGPDVKTLWTAWDSGGASGGSSNRLGPQHSAKSGASVTLGGITYLGETDMMDGLWNQRSIISDNDANILKDAYGYTIALPSSFGTYYDEVDSSGTLRIEGTSGNDTISVAASGSNFVVTMTLGAPVTGIDPVGAFTSTFAQSAVHSIEVYALGGNDVITVPQLTMNDTVIANGGSGTDTVIVDGSASQVSNPTYHISSNEITATKAGDVELPEDESFELKTGVSASTVDITDTSVPIYVVGQNTSAVYIGSGGSVQSINGSITLANPPSYDQVTVDDSADTAPKNPIALSDGSLTGLAPAGIYWTTTDVNALTIRAGSGGNQFDIASLNSSYTTNLFTGSGNDGINLENGSSNPSGVLSVDGQGGTNQLVDVDEVNASQTYTITSTGISRSGLSVTEANIGLTAIDAGASADTFNVNGDPAGSTLNLFAGGGVDTFNVGVASHSLPAFPNGATFDGSTDNANITFDNSSVITTGVAFFTSAQFIDGNNLNYSAMNNITYDGGSGTNGITIASTVPSTNYVINGGSGADNLNIGNGDISGVVNQLILSPHTSITFNPGGGTNSLTIDDHNGTTARNYNVTGSSVGASGLFALNYGTGLGYLTVSGGSGNDTVQLAAIIATIMTFNLGSGNDTLNVNSGSYFPPGDLGAGTQNLTLNVNAPGEVGFYSSQTLAGLNLVGNTYVAMYTGTDRVLSTRSLSLGSTSTLDLYNNDMIVDYSGATQLSNVQNLINSARGSGAWTGYGITSSSAKSNAKHSTTLGAMESWDYKSIYGYSASFDSQPIDNTAVLVKYTYYGDANFSGTVDGGDYARADLTFSKESSQGNIGGWINGDFDGDGRVTGADYGLADLAFGAQTGPINPPSAFPDNSPPVHMGGGRAGAGLPLG